jgi:hypothetical protein
MSTSTINRQERGNTVAMLLLTLFCIITGCAPKPAQRDETSTAVIDPQPATMAAAPASARTATMSASATPIANPCTETTLLTVTLIDNTGSMADPTAPRPIPQDFEPLFTYLAHCGGSAAVGAITDQATAFVRVDLEPPPTPPATEEHGATDLITQAASAADDDAVLRAYRVQRAAWQAGTNEKLAAFLDVLTPILDPANFSATTDLADPLAQADTFFLEPRRVPVEKRRCVLILYGDGKADPPQQLSPLKSRPLFLLVNGIGLGDLQTFSVNQFGDFPSALDFALSGGR